MINSFQNILIIGAHHDDSELACSGTAMKYLELGSNVYKLTLTDNETNSSDLKIYVQPERSKIDSAKAARIVGYKELSEIPPIKCNFLVYNTNYMQSLESLIYKYNIDTVFIHHHSDSNMDHIEANKIVITASRHVKNVLLYKSNFHISTDQFNPTLYIDISDYIEKKTLALKQYEDQHDRNGRLFSSTIDRNRIWGTMNRVDYCEAFQVFKLTI